MLFKNLCIAFAIQKIDAIDCFDEEKNPVDTWSIFKLPHGSDYFYYDTTVESLLQSPYILNDTSSGALTNTVTQIWTEGVKYALFNDELPEGGTYNFTVGHTKGIWIWDSDSALILTQSTPKYPSGPSIINEYQGIPSNGWWNGQSATCIKIDLSDFLVLTSLWQRTLPQIYDSYCGNEDCPWVSTHHSSDVYTSNPCAIKQQSSNTWFFKTAVTPVDIWSECIGSYFQTNLTVESWIHGDAEGPYCPPNYPFSTVDVQKIAFSNETAFSEYNDHSKWGIGTSPLVCMGDINRMSSQYSRGGVVVCWNDVNLWNSLSISVQSTNYCPPLSLKTR